MTEQHEASSGHAALQTVLLEIEGHVGRLGWDQPARLFALVNTDDLLTAEPTLAEALASGRRGDPASLTAVEQDEFHAGNDLLEDLERVAWPASVLGCALSVERVFVPASVEGQIPEDSAEAADFVAHHPERQDLRVVVGVTRAGASHGFARLKTQPDELLSGTDLVPGLARALARTLE